MSREVRRVPPDWKHPTIWREDWRGEMVESFDALFDGAFYEATLAVWDDENAKWEAGEFPDYADEDHRKMTYAEWNGERPEAKDYMPRWTPEEATHLMMYETTSEGTPISPAFATPEELARWLADNNASASGSRGASYEAWLRVARGGWAPTAISTPETGMVSGVEAMAGIDAHASGAAP